MTRHIIRTVIGRTISHYRIIEKIGEGGMGVVYLADDLRLRRRVALKVIKPDVAADAGRRARLEHEAQAAAGLAHENIAAVHAFEIDSDGTCAIVLEYVPGTNVRELLERGAIPLDMLLALGIQIADGLDAAHRAGVVHRDLKPENVIVTPSGRAKLLDFGVARVLGDPALQSTSTRLTAPGTVVGTMSYCAPEQLTAGPIDGRSDIFALGLVLYEMATGRPAFHSRTPVATAAEILAADVPPLAAGAPAELERIIRKCLRKNPDERYQSAREVAVDLRNLQLDLGTAAHRPPPAPWLESRRRTRRPENWWHINNLFDMAGLTVGIVFLPKLRDAIGSTIGAAWYFPAVALAAAVLSIRAFLFVVGFFDPPSLARELKRTMRWLKAAEALMFCFVLIAAVLMAGSAPSVAGFLIVITVGGFIVALFVEPLMVRSAFPQLASDTSIVATRTLRRRAALGSMQLVMTAPWLVMWYGAARIVANDGALLIKNREWPLAVGVLLGLTVGCCFGLSLAMGMLQGRSAMLRQYIRWYPLHLIVNLLAILFAVLAGLRYTGLAGGLAALILAFVPIYQRRLALALLDQRTAPDFLEDAQ